MSSRGGDAAGGRPGFSLIELLAVVVVFGILASVAVGAFRRYVEVTAADRAAAILVGDLSRARSYAVQRRGVVSLVVDEANLSYEIRPPGGPVLAVQDFGASDPPLTALDIQLADSAVFNARGLMLTGPLRVDLTRYGASRRVEVSALGRARVTAP